MRFMARVSGAVRGVAVALTVVFAALALVVGQAEEVVPVVLQEGSPAPQTFIATERVTVVDTDATEAARELAAGAVADVFVEDTQATNAALDSIQDFFDNARAAAEPLVIPPGDEPGSVGPSTTTTSSTTTTLPPEDSTTTVAPDDTSASADTLADDTSTTSSTTTTTTTTLPPTTTTTTEPPPPPRQLQIAELRDQHPLLRIETITVMVDILNDDYDRSLAGEQEIFRFVEDEALTLARQLLEGGIRATELEGVRADLVTNPPALVLLRDLAPEERELAEAAVADLVSVSLQANRIKNEAATEAARAVAADSVPDVTVAFVPGEAIVRANERVSGIQLEAIEQLDLLQPADAPPPLRAMALVTALIVILALFFLWRIGRDHWREPKLVALFGLLVVLAAVVSRVPELVNRDRVELGFLIPAALFGYLTANLFDSRTAVLMAVPVAAFTGLASGDLGLVVYAAAAALVPIPLVSAVSSRGQLNAAVLATAVVLMPLAGSISWYFNGSDTLVLAGLWGGASGLLSGVAALGILPFLSALFGVTTTQTLLDLTDRNHPALRLIEESAPGTFNHSIMVGNLAGKAARTIGGNPLLAQAMAYYHDFGKTVTPKYFVENQFGVSNPHDQLPPEESARIIRSHVAEGLRLAREFRIPPDVAQGILTHHGTSLMRFFYHKASDLYGDDVEAIDYRHRGRKPKSKEMVIVMLSDATEASARALVQHEDPTSEKLRVLVEQVIGEKVEDGQLEESDVTFGELTRIKEALVDALIGYYHTRIPYPGFPTTGGTRPA